MLNAVNARRVSISAIAAALLAAFVTAGCSYDQTTAEPQYYEKDVRDIELRKSVATPEEIKSRLGDPQVVPTGNGDVQYWVYKTVAATEKTGELLFVVSVHCRDARSSQVVALVDLKKDKILEFWPDYHGDMRFPTTKPTSLPTSPPSAPR